MSPSQSKPTPVRARSLPWPAIILRKCPTRRSSQRSTPCRPCVQRLADAGARGSSSALSSHSPSGGRFSLCSPVQWGLCPNWMMRACFDLALWIVQAATGTIWASVGVHLAFITVQHSALPQWAIWADDQTGWLWRLRVRRATAKSSEDAIDPQRQPRTSTKHASPSASSVRRSARGRSVASAIQSMPSISALMLTAV